MLEAALVGGVLLFAAVVALVPAEGLLFFGAALVALGLLVGLPAAAVYHAKLYVGLKASGSVPSLWWLSPTKHHDRVGASVVRRFAWSFRLGAGGFGVIVLGCILVAVAMWKLRAVGNIGVGS